MSQGNMVNKLWLWLWLYGYSGGNLEQIHWLLMHTSLMTKQCPGHWKQQSGPGTCWNSSLHCQQEHTVSCRWTVEGFHDDAKLESLANRGVRALSTYGHVCATSSWSWVWGNQSYWGLRSCSCSDSGTLVPVQRKSPVENQRQTCRS